MSDRETPPQPPALPMTSQALASLADQDLRDVRICWTSILSEQSRQFENLCSGLVGLAGIEHVAESYRQAQV
jgi:hypothetical protein